MEHRSQIPIKIAIDGEPVRCSTLATSVGAYILAIETVLRDQATDLAQRHVAGPISMVGSFSVPRLHFPDLSWLTIRPNANESLGRGRA